MKFKNKYGYLKVVPQTTGHIAFFVFENKEYSMLPLLPYDSYARMFLTKKQVEKLIKYLKGDLKK